MASKLLLFLSAFLLLVTARVSCQEDLEAVHDKHKAPPPAPHAKTPAKPLPKAHHPKAAGPPVQHHGPPSKPLTPPFSPPFNPHECVRQCEEKCKSHKKRVCERSCSKCCAECKCVPGKYGSQANCHKCYDKPVAHGIKCSALISAP